MYYVCYVVGARRNAVFPANWLKDHRKQLEKFINQSLNKNQQLLAYYSQEQLNHVENGQSPIDFRPDFQLSTNVEFPATGCYHVLPKRFFSLFDEAKSFAEHNRNVPPAVYDERRLCKVPLPNISQNDDSDSASDDTINWMTLNVSVDEPAMVDQTQRQGKRSP